MAKRYLVVNADDFGYSYGVNKGIIEAHTHGIITSTSVMVDGTAAHEARNLKDFSELSVGLHFAVKDFSNVEDEFKRQIDIFISIIGRKPDHLDTHKLRTTEKGFKQLLDDYSSANRIPVRSYGFAKFIDSYFGFHSEGDLSIERLKQSVDEATDEYNELMCHVGHADKYLREHSSYSEPREQELESMCDPSILTYIKEPGLTLTNWKNVPVHLGNF
jgi:chitin disaccharide deacetylase